ncbi:MAG: hypothetical protein COB02_17535 [Candidatus Cloacimonadota bacterium]|nr:MAG: hypothetical protein COB02_17535 [Candidatus Cloacimonadota bacterium]
MIFLHILSSFSYICMVSVCLKSILGNYLNIFSIFIIWWLFNYTNALVNPFQYYQLSVENITLFYFPVILIPLGFFLANYILQKKGKYINYRELIVVKSSFNIKVVTLFNFLGSFLLLYISYKAATGLGVSIQEFRDIVYSDDRATLNPIFSRISPILWFTGGINYYSIFFFTYIYISNESDVDSKWLVISIVTKIFYTLCTGGRTAFVDLMYILVAIIVLLYPIYKTSSHFRVIVKLKKIKARIRIFLVTLISGLILISILRGSSAKNDSTVLATITNYYVKYYTGTFYAFDQNIHLGLHKNFKVDRFGLSFLGFDTVLTSGFLRFVGGLNIPSLLSQSSYAFHSGVRISDDEIMNAHYTYLYTLYLDGGVFYIVIFSILFGSFYYLVYFSAVKRLSLQSFSLLLILNLFLINSVRTNLFTSPSIAICIILIYMSKFTIVVKSRRLL